MRDAERPFTALSGVARAQISSRRTPLAPREHGFWVILGVVVLSALSRAERSRPAWVAAIAVVAAAVPLGSAVGRRVRRSAGLQLGATVVLSLAGIPIQLAAGTTLTRAALDACTWVTMFTASALAVRACFARGSRRDQDHVGTLTLGSIGLPLLSAAVFAQLSLRPQAIAALATTAGMAAIAHFHPTPKHLKRVGIALAVLAVVAATVVRFA